MRRIIIAILATIIGGVGYSKFNNLKLNIVSVIETDKVPSGSGIVKYNNNYFIVGDDSPWLYNYKNKKFEKEVLISNSNKNTKARVSKKQKLDFEDIDIVNFENKDRLLIVSSGSKKVYRDSIFIMDTSFPYSILSKKNVRPLYDEMKKKAGIRKINIEGFTSDKNLVYFAHRGNHDRNVVFKIDKALFFEYIKSIDTIIPPMRVLSLELPKRGGMRSGLSSLQYIEKLDAILFTASIEGSKNTYEDGRIGTSYIGVFPVDKPHKMITSIVKKNDDIIKTKLEGICVSEIDLENHKMKAIAISDNDNGKTELFEISIDY